MLFWAEVKRIILAVARLVRGGLCAVTSQLDENKIKLNLIEEVKSTPEEFGDT